MTDPNPAITAYEAELERARKEMTGDTEQQAPGLDWDAASRKMIEQERHGTPLTDALFVQWHGKTARRPPSPVQPYGIHSVWHHADDLERQLAAAQAACHYPPQAIADLESDLAQTQAAWVEAMAELASSQHGYKLLAAERDELRQWQRELYLAGGNPWFWQGDGEDHLESLTCPILIMPEQLRALLAGHAEKQAEEIKRLKYDLENKSYEPTHNSTAEIAALKQRLEQSEKDTARLDWMIGRMQFYHNYDDLDPRFEVILAEQGLRAMIDAALAAEPPGGQQERGQ